jgi:hypothetical protein
MNKLNPRRSSAVIADVSPRTARSKRELMPMSDRSYAASACRTRNGVTLALSFPRSPKA